MTDSGRVVGIDVGYSESRKTTGICLLSWESEVDWRWELAGTDEASRLSAISKLGLSHSTPVDAVAVDGPLRPGLVQEVSYRAAESILSRGRFQKRGKPGQANAGSGPDLHRAATALAHLSRTHLQVRPARVRGSVAREAIFEAFPNLFLGVLCEDAKYPQRPEKGRKWTDTLFPLVRGHLSELIRHLLGDRRLARDLDMTDHEGIAAFVCALTALAIARRDYVAVGSAADGFIVLPPASKWQPWATASLEKSAKAAPVNFPGSECFSPATDIFDPDAQYGDPFSN